MNLIINLKLMGGPFPDHNTDDKSRRIQHNPGQHQPPQQGSLTIKTECVLVFIHCIFRLLNLVQVHQYKME